MVKRTWPVEPLPHELDSAQKVGRYVGRAWPLVDTEDIVGQLLEWLCRNGRHLERWRGEGKHGENKLRVALAREARKYARKEHDVRTGGPEDNGYKTEQIEEILRYLLTHDDWSEIGHQDSTGMVLASLSDASAGFHGLRKDDRRLLTLRYGDDLTLREVGEQVGCSEDAARMRVGRVLERLRSRMAGDAISWEGHR